MMDADVSKQYQQTLISAVSFSDFIMNGGQSKAAKIFVDLMKEQNDWKHTPKPSMSSMFAPKPMLQLNAPMIDPNMHNLSLDLNSDADVSFDQNVERIADILSQRLKDHKYKQFRKNLPT